MLRLLLEYGADVNARTNVRISFLGYNNVRLMVPVLQDDKTALDLARQNCCDEIIQVLEFWMEKVTFIDVN